MDQIVKVILAFDKVTTAPYGALNCGPCLDSLKQLYVPNSPTPSA